MMAEGSGTDQHAGNDVCPVSLQDLAARVQCVRDLTDGEVFLFPDAAHKIRPADQPVNDFPARRFSPSKFRGRFGQVKEGDTERFEFLPQSVDFKSGVRYHGRRVLNVKKTFTGGLALCAETAEGDAVSTAALPSQQVGHPVADGGGSQGIKGAFIRLVSRHSIIESDKRLGVGVIVAVHETSRRLGSTAADKPFVLCQQVFSGLWVLLGQQNLFCFGHAVPSGPRRSIIYLKQHKKKQRFCQGTWHGRLMTAHISYLANDPYFIGYGQPPPVLGVWIS